MGNANAPTSKGGEPHCGDPDEEQNWKAEAACHGGVPPGHGVILEFQVELWCVKVGHVGGAQHADEYERVWAEYGGGPPGPSKHSFVPAMMNGHNIGVFWGPYTPSTAPKNISACLGGYHPSIRHVSVERKASCGALRGRFHLQRPWSAMVVLVNVGRWRLTSDRPTVGIVKIVYESFFIPT